MFKIAEDSKSQKTWEKWPSYLSLPMMLMRENLKKSMIQALYTSNVSNSSQSSKAKNSSKVILPIQDNGGHECPDCGRVYKLKSSLRNHQKWECGKDPQFKCPFCVYKAKQKMHMARHMERMHKEIDYSNVKCEVSIKSENSQTEQS